MRKILMKELRIKDNQYRAKSDYYEVASITERIVDKTLEQLEREGVFVFPKAIKDAEDITRNQMILQSYNTSYKSGNIMGFLGLGKERLIIESRFSKEKDYFFQYLLEKVLDLPNFINRETTANQEDKMFHLLLFLFPKYLSEAMRKGLFKTYIRNEYNDFNIRGSIDIARHIKKNIPFIGNIAYCQREYSYDNYLLELVRHTIEVLKGKSCGNKILYSVKDEVKQIIEVTGFYRASDRRKVIEKNKKYPVRHAYFHEYRALQQLCILILQNQQYQFGTGNRNVYGILFDGAWLWEEYVNLLVGEEFYHPKNKNREGAQRLFSEKHGLIYPDFISKNAINRIIADAKYKPIENIGNKDYLQILAYMFRFDANRGYFFYPESAEKQDLCLFLNRGSTYEGNEEPRADVSVIKHGLKIPNDAMNYKDFVEKMKEQECEFCKKWK